jgi:hypothetical protein
MKIDAIKNYWNVVSKALPFEKKDNWLDDSGEPLDAQPFEEIAEYLASGENLVQYTGGQRNNFRSGLWRWTNSFKFGGTVSRFRHCRY